MEPFGTSSKQNSVSVGELRDVAAKSAAATSATLKKKRVKKKKEEND